MPARKDVSDRLRRLREERGLSQDELAVRAGLTQGSISLYEAGSRAPSTEALQKLAGVLGVPLAYLIEGVAAKDPLADPELQLIVRDLEALPPELRAVVRDVTRRLRDYHEARGSVAGEGSAAYEPGARQATRARKKGPSVRRRG